MAYTTINKSTDYFNTKLYTGTGSAQSISSVGFQPDWVWGKNRSTTNFHALYDAVRGSTKVLQSNTTTVEQTFAQGLTSFDSDGFTVGTDGDLNGSGNNIVTWNWKANGQGSANTDGTINTTYTSANTTAGISIIKYTGTGSNATIGHGLGVAPKMVMVKQLSNTRDWSIYHKFTNPDGTGAQYYMHLNNSDARASNSAFWNNTDPTNQVVNLGSISNTNQSSGTYIAYCFAEKTGFSKFGSYLGNGNDGDGSFIYTGFKPAFLMIKCTDTSGEHWHIHDTKRQTGNLNTGRYLLANTSDAESTSTSYAVDIISNGFKARTNNNSVNGSSKTYLYMAFGQSLVGSNNVPCTAR